MNSFKPNIIFSGGIRQTLLGHFSNLATPPEYQTIVVPLEGSESIICHHDNSQLPLSAPILMLFHGLGGCSESPYMLSISKAAAREHIRVIRFNHRGCGQGAGLAKKIYHSGRTKDMMLAIESIVNKFSEAPIFLCGFSLSANMLLSLVGRDLEKFTINHNIKGIMAVCPPIDLEKSSLKMTTGRNQIFNYYFGFKLINDLKKLERVTEQKLVDDNHKRITLREFDRVYTAALAGYKSRTDYYSFNSSKNLIGKISLPTYILAAEDDPIVDNSDLQSLAMPKNISLNLQKKGGHMGFISNEAIDGFNYRWMDYQVLNWIRNHIANRIT